MTVTVTIDDSKVAAFNAYLATQVTTNLDPVTHAVTTIPHFDGITGYVQTKIAEVVEYVATLGT